MENLRQNEHRKLIMTNYVGMKIKMENNSDFIDYYNITQIDAQPGGTPSSSRHHKNLPHYTIGIFLIKYLLPFVIFLGTIGNLLSFIVMMKRRMRHTSVYLYLAMLSFADTIVLYLSGFKTWIRLVTGEQYHYALFEKLSSSEKDKD